MIINKFKANNQNIVSKIDNYIFLETFDNVGAGFFEFYFDKPHMLSNDDFINISDSSNYNEDLTLFPNILRGNIPIRLRPQVRIGITATMRFCWKYADNSNSWVLMSGSGGLLEGTIDIPIPGGMVTQEFVRYEDSIIEVGIGEPFIIQTQNINGVISVREQHSTEWQHLINQSDLPNCGDFSDHSIITSVVINDTYFRIDRFELCRKINIKGSGYDDCGNFYFITDYGWNPSNNSWFDHLYSTPCECQEVCVITTEQSWIETFGGLLHSDEEGANCDVDHPLPNPDGIYGGGAFQLDEIIEEQCQIVSIRVYKHCDDQYEPICSNKDNVLKTANFDYSFSILDDIDYTSITEIRKCFSLDCLRIWRDVSFIQFNIGLDMNFDITLGRNDQWNTKFIEDEKQKAIGKIIDNERVRFEPFWKNSDGSFTQINHIKYQLIFLDNENKPNNWTDDKLIPENPTRFATLGFTDDDVKFQKMRLKKCFLRLSYYDDPNPTKQLLEHFNTVFVDTNLLYSKFIYNINSITGYNYNTVPISQFRDPYSGDITFGFRTEFDVFNPHIKKLELVPEPNAENAYRKDGPFYMNLSNTSDGFYIYLFDVSLDSKCNQYNSFFDPIPNLLWLKCEFNNAYTGKRHLFFNDKNKNGVDMDNVFFEKGNTPAYIWTKIWVEFNKNLNRYIWYPDVNNTNVKRDDKNPDTIVFHFYESYVK
jgi:hypothetical protein